MLSINDYLGLIVKHNASDLYLNTHAPATLKIEGINKPVNPRLLGPGEVKALAYSIMNPGQVTEFENDFEMNLAISRESIGRFRVNIFRQRNEVGMVIRSIKTVIPTPEELRLPKVLKEVVLEKKGLVLIVGATSTGKSTTLASLIDHRNSQQGGHIITIEDPIEYIHPNKRSIVTQREVGIDTISYENALKNTLRQAPDVILIGEIRARETMQHALTFAETGHLCLSTLHASNAKQALERIVHFFPEEARSQILLDLSLNLVAIVGQRLIPTPDEKRVVAVEVLLGTPYVRELIRTGQLEQITEAMEKSTNLGMQSFDSAIHQLYIQDFISEEEALRYADSSNDLRLKIALAKGVHEESDDLSIQKDDSPLEGSIHHPGEFIRDKRS